MHHAVFEAVTGMSRGDWFGSLALLAIVLHQQRRAVFQALTGMWWGERFRSPAEGEPSSGELRQVDISVAPSDSQRRLRRR